MSDLHDRVAWVTGAARGQGLAHARALAAAGAHVYLTDIAEQIDTVAYPMPTAQDLELAAAGIRDSGGQATAVRLDVRDPTAVNKFVNDVSTQHGRLDVLIANAGICAFSSIEEMTDAQWRDMIETNLTGTFNTVRAAVPVMARNNWGRIIGISSGAGRGGMSHLGHYGATKWGIIGFLKTLALEVGGYGITSNIVCPTTVNTPMVMNPATWARFRPDLDAPDLNDVRPAFTGLSPLGVPWLEPEDVTRAVMYLVNDPGLTTGTVLEVNLGTSATRI